MICKWFSCLTLQSMLVLVLFYLFFIPLNSSEYLKPLMPNMVLKCVWRQTLYVTNLGQKVSLFPWWTFILKLFTSFECIDGTLLHLAFLMSVTHLHDMPWVTVWPVCGRSPRNHTFGCLSLALVLRFYVQAAKHDGMISSWQYLQ